MIFLDTNIISYYFNANATIRDKILGTIERDGYICTTIINVYEISKGLKWKNSKTKETQFKAFLEDVSVFTLDEDATNIASSIYSDLRKNGKTIDDADILIASIVIKNNGILVSNNTKHYEGITQLRLTNWI